MTKRYVYHIANVKLGIEVTEDLEINSLLSSFSPFSVNETDLSTVDCFIELVNRRAPSRIGSETLLSDVSEVWGDRFRFFEIDKGYKTMIHDEGGFNVYVLESNEEFSRSTVYLADTDFINSSVFTWLVMMVFGQTCLLHKVILIHASAVAVDDKSYAFLGKSGTGKSTHSRLWLEHINGAELLNDDNPAIRLEEDGKVYLYGTPWSGKTPCYKNVKVQLGAFIRLKQAAYNRFSQKIGLEAFVNVMPSCTAIRWNRRLFQEMNNTLEDMIRHVPVAHLECLPNREAAQYCYENLLNININTNSNAKIN